MGFLPIDRMQQQRIAVERTESDSAFFDALMYEGEMVLKLVVAGMVAAVVTERERHRYRLIHRLVRADGLGEWADVLDDLVVGPAAQYLDTEAREAQRHLTQNYGAESWQYRCIALVQDCLEVVGVSAQPRARRVPGRQFFREFVRLRNETRGHGARSPDRLSRACPPLEEAINLGLLTQEEFEETVVPSKMISPSD